MDSIEKKFKKISSLATEMIFTCTLDYLDKAEKFRVKIFRAKDLSSIDSKEFVEDSIDECLDKALKYVKMLNDLKNFE